MNPLFDAAGLTVFERGWLSSNNILFDGGDEHATTLVDSGYCSHAEQTVALVRQALGARPLQHLVNTHLHSDHCGGNHALQQAFGCRISVPLGEASKVDDWDEDALTFKATGQRCPRFHRWGAISAGAEVWCGSRAWRAIAAPGHDPQSIVLHEPELGLLISADALWENGFGVVFPELEGIAAFDDVRNTLDVLSQLHVRWVIPGHGSPFADIGSAITRAHRRLDGLIADPARHARHASKVLIKFHLLEVQRIRWRELLEWLLATPYMALSHRRHAASVAFEPWCVGLVDELAASGALSTSNGVISNA